MGKEGWREGEATHNYVEDDKDGGDTLRTHRRVLLSDVGDQAAEDHCSRKRRSACHQEVLYSREELTVVRGGHKRRAQDDE